MTFDPVAPAPAEAGLLLLVLALCIMAAYFVGHRHGYRDAMEDFR
ncbi:MAG: hypothetical protein KatS3mg127_1283 [Silanimonas sp.]|nr:MAG: hypothetical protein KatS3mg127_1283 [Silanimonas sp.]